jgi:hypothetical protein
MLAVSIDHSKLKITVERSGENRLPHVETYGTSLFRALIMINAQRRSRFSWHDTPKKVRRDRRRAACGRPTRG